MPKDLLKMGITAGALKTLNSKLVCTTKNLFLKMKSGLDSCRKKNKKYLEEQFAESIMESIECFLKPNRSIKPARKALGLIDQLSIKGMFKKTRISQEM